MIRNFLKTAWRTLVHNRTYSLTNLIGLTLGLTVVMLITTRVLDELSFDQHWSQKDEIHRIRTSYETHGNRNQTNLAPGGLAQAWAADFAEIRGYTTIGSENTRFMLDSLTGDHAELTLLRVDTGFFSLFDTHSITGNPRQLLAHAHNLAITESAHRLYFGGQPVEGKIFYTIPEHGDPEPYVVHAILRDLPQNSSLQADAIVVTLPSAAYQPGKNQGSREQYLLLSSGTDTALLSAKLNAWYQQRETEERNLSNHFSLQSIKDVYLRSANSWEASPLRDVYIFSGVGLLILILISINFINLTFAHAVKRTTDTGVRKVLGAGRRHFFYQLGTESLLLFSGSFLLAFVLYLLAFQPFETFLQHPLTIGFHRSFLLFTGMLTLWLTLGLLCSLFPALALSKTKTALGLKKQLSVLSLPMNTGLTRGLVTIQFSLAILVVICMLTIRAQINYMDTKNLGYEPENLLLIEHFGWEGKSKAFKETLLRQPGIQSVSLTQWSPFSGSVSFGQFEDPENPDNGDPYALINVDFDFVETMGMDVLEGRNLDPDIALDAVSYTRETIENQTFANVLITESTARKYGMGIDQSTSYIKNTPVGVIQDLHGASLRYPLFPFIIEAQRDGDNLFNMLIRTVEGQEQQATAALHSTWKQFFPGQILPRIHWVADQVRAQYDSERKQYQQLAFFGAISMLIALLGVLGLAIYTIERRIKEIGIRKILGASVNSIVALMSRSFVAPVLIAAVLAFPAAWWFMNRWLENFAYRIDISFGLFVLTGAVAFVGMLCVVGWQTARAAAGNPVESLRDE